MMAAQTWVGAMWCEKGSDFGYILKVENAVL